MEATSVEINVKGRLVKVPSVQFEGLTIVTSGKWFTVARVRDEDWLEGEVPENPETCLAKIKQGKLKADIFTFAQKIPNIKPRYDYHMEWDNVAAIPITTYQDWWEYVSTDMRKDVKRAKSRDVIIKVEEFNDEIVKGVIEINNDTPTRQGFRFYHFGKDFDTVKKEYSSYQDRSEFICAYHNDELIGLIKMVYVGDLACFMQILSKRTHYDKRPTNALIAKAVEICNEKGKSYLTYGKYNYGNKQNSSLLDFKRRNGFERILFPRYYIPLTLKGRIIIQLRLHRGLLGILPAGLISLLVYLRSKFNQHILFRFTTSEKNVETQPM
jgi:hypothetical protein